jgi:hypothetical protein
MTQETIVCIVAGHKGHPEIVRGLGTLRSEGGDGFCEVYVNMMEGFWSLLRSCLRPHRGVSQENFGK